MLLWLTSYMRKMEKERDSVCICVYMHKVCFMFGMYGCMYNVIVLICLISIPNICINGMCTKTYYYYISIRKRCLSLIKCVKSIL